MSETAWLKQVLEDAKAAKDCWPDWAKDSAAETSLNSDEHAITELPNDRKPVKVKNSDQTDLGLD